MIEETFDVYINDVVRIPFFDVDIEHFKRIMTTSIWAKAKGAVKKILFIDGIEDFRKPSLYDSIFIGGEYQVLSSSLFPVCQCRFDERGAADNFSALVA